MKFQILFFLGILSASSIGAAYNVSGCAGYLNEGLYKKYKYMGHDGALGKISTEKKGMTTKESSTDASSEGTTASVDPVYTTHTALSGSQYISSWGNCSGMALNNIKEQRDLYFVQNQEEILKEISLGRGEHLLVLADMTLCEAGARPQFSQQLQSHMAKFLNMKGSVSSVMDQIVIEDKTLSQACYSFGG